MSSFKILHGTLTLTCPDGYPRPPEDALHLAASLKTMPAHYGLDAGCGIGTAALAFLHTNPGTTMHGVDINPALTAAAKGNATANNLPLTTSTEDILTHTPLNPYNFILCNPPFHESARGHTSANPNQTQRHTMPPTLLEDWLTHFLTITTPAATLAFMLHSHQQQAITTLAAQHHLKLTLTPWQTSPQRPPKRIIAHLTRTIS